MSKRIFHLRRPMIEDMTVRNLSPATQASYITAVKKFSRYYRRSPEQLGVEDVRAYQVHLTENAIAWASLNQTVSAKRSSDRKTQMTVESPKNWRYYTCQTHLQ